MKKWLIPLLLASCLTPPSAWAGNSMTEIAQRCQPLSKKEQPLYAQDFKWGYDLPEMLLKFTQIYHAPKRLPQRAFWDKKTQTLKIPYDQYRGGDIPTTSGFIQAISDHIENAFALRYVDAVFFPDMGHSHLLIPTDLMKDKYDLYPVNQMSSLYRDVFHDRASSGKIKFFYSFYFSVYLGPWRFPCNFIPHPKISFSKLSPSKNPKSRVTSFLNCSSRK